MFLRWASSDKGQDVCGWSGFVSAIGEVPQNKTTIEYYPVINSPITEYTTVQQCLRYAEKATHEVGQEYVICTFDLGVCMKAYPLVWNNPDRYKKHIVLIGSFHVICAYLKMIGKKMQGTGLGDVFLEAGLITSGSLDSVLKGKQYTRAMTCHKATMEALERLLLKKFLAMKNISALESYLEEDQQIIFKTLMESPSSQNLKKAQASEEIVALLQEYQSFKQSVRDGEYGKTSRLWLSYMDHISIILNLIHAVKVSNISLYTECLHRMADLFFSFNGQNYARYLSFFSVFLANIEETHPGSLALLENGAISVARSMIPGNRCPVDKTMEETFMKSAKSRGGSGNHGAGLTGLENNLGNYQRWVRTTHERTRYVEATFSMADMMAESRMTMRHKDLRPTEIRKSEGIVQKTMDAFLGFMDPFDIPDKDKLYCLSSGGPVDGLIELDVLSAEEEGKQAKEKFIKERLEKKCDFFEPIKRMKLKTMMDYKKSMRVKTSKNKITELKQQSGVILALLVKIQSKINIDFEDLMSYPLTPVPYSIGTADGYLTRTDKSKGFNYLVKDVEAASLPDPNTTLLIEDGNALFHYMSEVPKNFRDICEKLYLIMAKRSDVICSTDMYQPHSIKGMERNRRGVCEKFIVQGEMTKKPADWREFLANDENKIQLIRIMLKVWSSNSFAAHIGSRQVTLICEGQAYQLTTRDGTSVNCNQLASLASNQEETDSRVILYCKYAQEQGYSTVRVRSPDCDIFFILLLYVHELTVTVLFETGTGNKKKLINITELAEDFTGEYATSLTALHVFTKCDTTSAFKGIGKVKPIKLLQKTPRYQTILTELGKAWQVSNTLLRGLEEFTCALYGRKRFTSVNKLRFNIIKEKCMTTAGNIKINHNIDMSLLPPSSRALEQHVRRANYQMALWRRSHVPIFDPPSPTDGQGWHLVEGKLEPLWYDGDSIPQHLVDNLSDEDLEDDDLDSEFEDVHELTLCSESEEEL